MAKDTWFKFDLPVLDAIVSYLDEHDDARPQLYDIAEVTGIEESDVIRAADRLDGVFIELRKTMGPSRLTLVMGVSAEARVVTGQWPTAGSMADRIIAGLENAAEQEPDEGKKDRLLDAARVLGETARDLGTNVLASVIAKQLGLG